MDEMSDNVSNNNTPIRKSREKSASYPYYNLKECINYLEIIHEIGGKKEAPIESILSKLNISSRHNRRFTYLTSSSENFGLIIKTINGLKPTELGTSILFPMSGEDERKEKLITSFKSPQLYQKIIKKYNHTVLPNNEILKNVFYNMNIAKNALNKAANAFLESARYANVLDGNNRLTVPDSSDTDIYSSQISDIEKDVEGQEETQSKINEHPTTIDQKSNYHKFEIMTSTGKKASISLPDNSTKDDIEKIKRILEVFT